MLLYLITTAYLAAVIILRALNQLDVSFLLFISFAILFFMLSMIQEDLSILKELKKDDFKDLFEIKKILNKIEINTSVLAKIAINKEERREKR